MTHNTRASIDSIVDVEDVPGLWSELWGGDGEGWSMRGGAYT